MTPIPPRPASLAELGRFLRAARKSAALTLDQLSDNTGISKPYLSNIETARAPGPPSEPKLRALAKALQMDPGQLLAAADWLRTPISIRKSIIGPNPPRRADGAIDLDQLMRTGPDDTTTNSVIGVKRVPLINRVAAGKAGEFGDLSYPAGVADSYIMAPDLPEAPASTLFALRVLGDSMLPEYREGDILIVGPGEARDGDDCVVRTGELEGFATTFKRVFFLKDAGGEATGARLVPLNPAYPERVVKLEEVTGIYPLAYRMVPGRPAARGGVVKASEKLKGGAGDG